jgi:thioredoxin reductase (NADPH)
MITTDVENYPGFPEGVSGPDLMEMLQKQAERFGAEVRFEDATAVELGERPFEVQTDSDAFTCDALIVATGASARWLGLPSETEYMNRGVSACATCDGALYRDRAMVVVGGGDTAMEEALFLTRFATRVYVVHRRDQLRASKIMADRALDHPKIEFVWNAVVDDILGDGKSVTGVRIRDVHGDEKRTLEVQACFIAIGHQPNTELFDGVLDRQPNGYLRVEPGSSRTNIEGVFACGDVMDATYRQAVTAAGTGCMAALDAERWLAERQ